MWDTTGAIPFAPDEQVQAVVRLSFSQFLSVSLSFSQFEEVGTLGGLLRSLARHDIRLGVRVREGPGKGQLVWRRANRAPLQTLLKHPLYAGAYVYGRRQMDRRRSQSEQPQSSLRAASEQPQSSLRAASEQPQSSLRAASEQPQSGRVVMARSDWHRSDWHRSDWHRSDWHRSDWHALLPDRCPAYLSWEQYEQNLARLAANRNQASALGAVRKGEALLAGLVICSRCGVRMGVHYQHAMAWAANTLHLRLRRREQQLRRTTLSTLSTLSAYSWPVPGRLCHRPGALCARACLLGVIPRGR